MGQGYPDPGYRKSAPPEYRRALEAQQARRGFRPVPRRHSGVPTSGLSSRTAVRGLLRRFAHFVPYLKYGIDIYDLFKWLSEASAGGVTEDGWNITLGCGSPVIGPFKGGNTGCVQILASDLEPGIGLLFGFIRMCRYFDATTHEVGGLDFYWHQRSYDQLLADATPAPVVNPDIPSVSLPKNMSPWPVVGQAPYPPPQLVGLDPESMPVASPSPVPKPLPFKWLPHRFPNPFRSPGYRREVGPRSVKEAPGEQTQSVSLVSPGIKTVTASGALPRPPGKGVKEKKVMIGSGNQFVRLVLNPITEADDLIDSLFAALPLRCQQGKGVPPRRKLPVIQISGPVVGISTIAPRRKHVARSRGLTKFGRASPQAKLELLYECWSEIDIKQAIINVVQDNLIDIVAGTLSRRAGRVKREIFEEFGISFIKIPRTM